MAAVVEFSEGGAPRMEFTGHQEQLYATAALTPEDPVRRHHVPLERMA